MFSHVKGTAYEKNSTLSVTMTAMISVSYTHLDVYKRQNYPFPLTDLHQNQQALRTLEYRDVCKKLLDYV